MCSVGQNSTMSVGGDAAPGTMLAGSVGGGAGGASILTGRKRIGTLLGGQPVSGTPGPRNAGSADRDPRPGTQPF